MPQPTLDAYIFFTGNCREGMAFYKSIFGGELTFLDMPGETKPDEQARVMHAALRGGLVELLGSDGDRPRTDPYPQGAVSLTITGSDEQQLRDIFNKLAEGGKVTSELKQEFWGAIFGSLTDKYNVDWMINIEPAQAAQE